MNHSSSRLPTLQSLSAYAVSLHYVESFEQFLLEKHQEINETSLDEILHSKSSLIELLHQIPFELVKNIIVEVERNSPVVALLLAGTFKDRLDTLSIQSSNNKPVAIPRRILLDSASRLGAALHSLHICSFDVNDAFLIALSMSSSASSLSHLSLPKSGLTSQSASAWAAFSQLKSLTLDDSYQLDLVSIQSITKLSTLERLSIEGLWRCSTLDVLDAVFSPYSLPNLTTFSARKNNCASESDERAIYAKLMSLLENRPALETLRVIGLSNLLFDDSNQITLMCNNLERPFAPTISHDNLMALGERASRFKRLRTVVDSHANLSSLFELCPSLENLVLGSMLSQRGQRFDQATSLLKLKCEYPSNLIAEGSHWPSNLESLDIRVWNARASEAELLQWIRDLGNGCPNLKSLKIYHSDSILFNQDHFDQLALSLPNLHEIVIPIERGQLLPLTIHNAHLTSLHNFASYSVPCFTYLPNLEVLKSEILDDEDVRVPCAIHPSRTPRIHRVRVGKHQYRESSPQDMCAILESLSSCKKTLFSLSLRHPLDGSHLESLKTFNRLRDLTVQTEAGPASVSKLLDALPLLARFKLYNSDLATEYTQLKHKNIQRLHFEAVTFPEEFVLSEDSFPALRDLRFVSSDLQGLKVTNIPEFSNLGMFITRASQLVVVENFSATRVGSFVYIWAEGHETRSDIPPNHRLMMRGAAIKVANMEITSRTLADLILDFEEDSDNEKDLYYH